MGYFNVNIFPCLIALLITKRTFFKYSSVNGINDIYFEVGHPGISSHNIISGGGGGGDCPRDRDLPDFLTPCPELIRVYEISIWHILHFPYLYPVVIFDYLLWDF